MSFKPKLTSLDVSKNTKLTDLMCGGNPLMNLDISKNTKLVKLVCNNNQFQGLDISKNIALRKLDCNNNSLKNLDISKNTELEELDCRQNQLTSLDVSKNTKLVKLNCSNNRLSEEALNALFTSLHSNNTEEKKIIYISGNLGAESCDKTIAEKKGWEVISKKNCTFATLKQKNIYE